MKKIILSIVLAFVALAFVGCDKNTTEAPVGSEYDLTILKFPHLDGHGSEVMKDMPILFEYEMRGYVKYQVAFVACTCRAPRDNFWSVAYIDISTETGEILYISFEEDSSGHYQAGVWGDSNPIPETEKTYEDFKNDFLPWIVGKTADDLDGINIFYDEAPAIYADYANTKTIGNQELIDSFSGSSVSTHSIIRVVKVLLDYHQEQYMAE
jgi:hypothetical protein